MPCLTEREVSQFLLGTLPAEVADDSEEHLLACDRCLFSADSALVQDDLLEALRCPEDAALEELEDDEDRSLIIRLIGRLGELAGEVGASSWTEEELQQILSPPEADDEIGRLSHFRILQVLGAGGMGIVFQAEDVELGRTVALKVMRPALAADAQAKRRFRREAQAAAAFEHENIVTIYQVEEDRGVPFFSMQWLEGESLAARLRRSPKLPIEEALQITREVATGLAAAHARGLLHRDIKPDNIWLEKGPGSDHDDRRPSPFRARVKIVDFGLVRSLDEPSSLTHSGMILGTPQYMAPEQACGEEVDARSDLFSVGCVLYQLLTGRPAFDGPNVVATLVAVSKAEAPPPHVVEPAIPRRVSDLTMRLLAREPSDRPGSAAELAREVAAIEAELPELQVRPARLPIRRRLWIGALAAGLAAIALGIIAVQTNKGTLFIEADDDVAVLVEGDAVELHDRATGQKFALSVGENPVRPGEYEIVTRDQASGLEFSSRQFAIRRGDKKRISVTLELSDALAAVARREREPLDPIRRDARPALEDRTYSRAELEALGIWPASPPDWLGDVEDSLGIGPGEPLSPLALVQKPRELPGTISWTVEPAQHRGGVNDAVFSPDGSRIATAGQDGTVRIYDTHDHFAPPQQIIICPGVVSALAWSPSGLQLATAQNAPTPSICIWRLGEQVKLAAKINRSTEQLAWSPDESLLAFEDNGVQLWSPSRGEVLPNFGMTGTISRRPWSADGVYLASSDKDSGAMNVWNVAEKKLHMSIGGTYRSGPIFAAQGYFLAALDHTRTTEGSLDNRSRSIHVWDLERNQRVKNIPTEPAWYRGIAWTSDGSRIAALTNQEANLWDVKTGEQLPMSAFQQLASRGNLRRMCEWSADGQRLLVIRYGQPMTWQATMDTWKSLQSDNAGMMVEVRNSNLALRTYYDGERNAAGYVPSRADVWDLTDLRKWMSVGTNDVESFDLSPTGRRLALIGPQTPVRAGGFSAEELRLLELALYDTTSGELLHRNDYDAIRAFGVQWSPDEIRLLMQQPVSATHQSVGVVDADTGQVLHQFDVPLPFGRRGAAFSFPVAWSPDGARIVFHAGGTLSITDVETGEAVRRLELSAKPVRDGIEAAEEDLQKRVEEARGRTGRGQAAGGRGGSGFGSSFEINRIAWSDDARWVAAHRVHGGGFGGRGGAGAFSSPIERTDPSSVVVWDLSNPEGEIVLELPLTVERRGGGGVPPLLTLLFSPDGKRLLARNGARNGDQLLCWDIESGSLILETEIGSEGGEVLGWLTDSRHLALFLGQSGTVAPSRRIVIQEVGGDQQSSQIALYGTPRLTATLLGDRIYVSDGRANTLQQYGPTLELESTFLLHSDAEESSVVELQADGEIRGQSAALKPLAVLLTPAGQETIAWEAFVQRWDADNLEPDGD